MVDTALTTEDDRILKMAPVGAISFGMDTIT